MSLESLRIQGKIGRYFTPDVDFNVETGICWLQGESYLVDCSSFYRQLFDWLNAYFEAGHDEIEMNFKMRFFSTSSSKSILELLFVLKNWEEKGKKITIKWHYPYPDDDEMKEEGEDYEADCEIKFEYVSYDVG